MNLGPSNLNINIQIGLIKVCKLSIPKKKSKMILWIRRRNTGTSESSFFHSWRKKVMSSMGVRKRAMFIADNTYIIWWISFNFPPNSWWSIDAFIYKFHRAILLFVTRIQSSNFHKNHLVYSITLGNETINIFKETGLFCIVVFFKTCRCSYSRDNLERRTCDSDKIEKNNHLTH